MIKRVGSTTILDRHKATCHCGAVEHPFDLGPVPTFDGVNHPADRREA